MEAFKEALRRASVPPDQVLAVACTTIWAVTVAVDGRGNACSPALTWVDTRGGPYARALANGWPKVTGYDAQPDPVWMGSAISFKYLKRARLDIYAQRAGGGAAPSRNSSAAVSVLWRQIAAAVLGCPVRQVANPRSANAVGIAMTAFAALGDVAVDEIASKIRTAGVYHPRQEYRRVHDDQYAAFINFHGRLNPKEQL